jgi:hypothetical protein
VLVAATAYYSLLSRLADTDASLEAELQEATSFFAIGHRKKRPGAATT